MGPTLTPLLSAQQSTNSHSARKGNEGSSSSFQPVLLLYLSNSSLQPAIGDTNQIFPSLRSNASGYHGYSTKNSLKIKVQTWCRLGFVLHSVLQIGMVNKPEFDFPRRRKGNRFLLLISAPPV